MDYRYFYYTLDMSMAVLRNPSVFFIKIGLIPIGAKL